MYVVVRIRGRVGKSSRVKSQLSTLGLSKKHSFSIVPKDRLPMIKKVKDYVTWGEISDENKEKLKNKKLQSPKKGFRSIKSVYPKGDLGYRGDKINELIERMM